MTKKLARYTTVAGTTYAPGDVPPKEIVDLIDNPKVWESEDSADEKPAARRASK